ncbi:hypothetical protein ACLGI4_15665 [Streptomyces sp. HMX112]|uniref:hypothetical protein n=1 Tax=Streptomyces sp. HMX112 TaxID=3390850 RepID=UPI003A800862
MSLGEENGGGMGGGTGQTRTRLPDSGSGDVYGGARRPTRSSRSLITVVGVVVLLIAAIAFANRSGDAGGDDPAGATGKGPATATAATGVRPVAGRNGAAIPSGFAHTEQGAQSAAANYAVALGSDGMFNTQRRHEIVQAVADAGTAQKLQAALDTAYSKGLLAQMGLAADGTAPAGATFVNRTLPAGTKVKDFGGGTADVDVWYVHLFGLTGETSTKPVTSGWFTMNLKLKWNGSDWKVLETSQRTGPTPVTGDNPVSGSDEIAAAVNEYGGFTYAR